MEVDSEQQAVLIEQAKEEARRQAAAVIQQAAQDPEQQREWIQQNNLIYGGLIAIGLVLVQPFITAATPTLNWSAKICAIAFSVAIPLLAALILVSRQETFRRRTTDSLVVRATRAVAQLLAFVGVVAGFWHIVWIAGVGILVSGFVAMMVHSAGYFRLEIPWASSMPVATVRRMTDAPVLGTGRCLDFMAPLSAGRADRLAAELAAMKPSTVVDLGCGWGELLLRILAACPDARGVGVDTHGPDLVRGRHNAAARSLSDRVTFIEGPAAEHLGAADVLINLGAHQALGDVAEALRALHDAVNPGGRVLFGAEFWEHPPTAGELANMWPGISADDCGDLAGLVDRAVAAGFRPLRIETATAGEWEEFESGLAADAEAWLLTHADHPEAGEVRAKLDAQRDIWLRGHRNVMGFAYLTLGRS